MSFIISYVAIRAPAGPECDFVWKWVIADVISLDEIILQESRFKSVWCTYEMVKFVHRHADVEITPNEESRGHTPRSYQG